MICLCTSQTIAQYVHCAIAWLLTAATFYSPCTAKFHIQPPPLIAKANQWRIPHCSPSHTQTMQWCWCALAVRLHVANYCTVQLWPIWLSTVVEYWCNRERYETGSQISQTNYQPADCSTPSFEHLLRIFASYWREIALWERGLIHFGCMVEG